MIHKSNPQQLSPRHPLLASMEAWGESNDKPKPTSAEMVILGVLCQNHNGISGKQLVVNSEAQVKGGSVHVLLDRLIRKGFVEESKNGLARSPIYSAPRIYRVTGSGRKAYMEGLNSLEDRETIFAHA